MRISESMKTSTFLYDLNKSMEKMLNTQNQLTTTKRINKPSDDPSGTAKLMRLKNSLSRYQRYQENVEDATFFVSASESSLSDLQDTISTANSILLQAANDTVGIEERKTLGGQVRDLWERVVQTANNKFANRYLFGGTNDETPPYTLSDQVENESFTAEVGETVLLDNTNMISGSAVVSEYFEEGVDFTVDYENGTITRIDGGRMVEGEEYFVTLEINEGIPMEETLTASSNPPFDLANENLLYNSIKVYRHFTEETDFTVDYENGSITALESGNIEDGRDYTISYQVDGNYVATLNPEGVDGDVYREVDEGILQKINVSAEEVFGGDAGLIKGLKDAYTALERNDTEAMKEARTILTENIDSVTSIQGRLGVIQNRLDFQASKITSDDINMQKLISSIEDTDIVKAMVELENDQLVYQAALNAGSKIIQRTLIDFLS